jgi:hypothetical protein
MHKTRTYNYSSDARHRSGTQDLSPHPVAQGEASLERAAQLVRARNCVRLQPSTKKPGALSSPGFFVLKMAWR